MPRFVSSPRNLLSRQYKIVLDCSAVRASSKVRSYTADRRNRLVDKEVIGDSNSLDKVTHEREENVGERSAMYVSREVGKSTQGSCSKMGLDMVDAKEKVVLVSSAKSAFVPERSG
jgi:hypothetical protein